ILRFDFRAVGGVAAIQTPLERAERFERTRRLTHLRGTQKTGAARTAELQRHAGGADVAVILGRSVVQPFGKVADLAGLDPTARAVADAAAQRHADLIEVVPVPRLVFGAAETAVERDPEVVRRADPARKRRLYFDVVFAVGSERAPRHVVELHDLN